MSIAAINPVLNANARNPLFGGLGAAYYQGNGQTAPVNVPRPAGGPDVRPVSLPNMSIRVQTPEASAASKMSNYTIQYPRLVSADTYMRDNEFDDVQPHSVVFTSYNPNDLPHHITPTSQENSQICGLRWLNRKLREHDFSANDALMMQYVQTYTDVADNLPKDYLDPPWQRLLDKFVGNRYDGLYDLEANSQMKEALKLLSTWRLDGVLLTSELNERRMGPSETNISLMFNVAVKGRALVRNGNDTTGMHVSHDGVSIVPRMQQYGFESHQHEFDEKVRCGHKLYVGVHIEAVPNATDRYIFQLRLWSSRKIQQYSMWNGTSDESQKQSKALMRMVGAWCVGTVVDSRASLNSKVRLDRGESFQVEAYVDCKWMPLPQLKARNSLRDDVPVGVRTNSTLTVKNESIVGMLSLHEFILNGKGCITSTSIRKQSLQLVKRCVNLLYLVLNENSDFYDENKRNSASIGTSVGSYDALSYQMATSVVNSFTLDIGVIFAKTNRLFQNASVPSEPPLPIDADESIQLTLFKVVDDIIRAFLNGINVEDTFLLSLGLNTEVVKAFKKRVYALKTQVNQLASLEKRVTENSTKIITCDTFDAIDVVRIASSEESIDLTHAFITRLGDNILATDILQTISQITTLMQNIFTELQTGIFAALKDAAEKYQSLFRGAIQAARDKARKVLPKATLNYFIASTATPSTSTTPMVTPVAALPATPSNIATAPRSRPVRPATVDSRESSPTGTRPQPQPAQPSSGAASASAAASTTQASSSSSAARPSQPAPPAARNIGPIGTSSSGTPPINASSSSSRAAPSSASARSSKSSSSSGANPTRGSTRKRPPTMIDDEDD